uniref:Uncharacterized protein n=1 Tax=Solanum lycopersicum TaxID=4081 RepID=A0A3Q7IUY3_SOLLC
MVYAHHLVFIKHRLLASPLYCTQRQTNVGHGLPECVVAYTLLNKIFLWTAYIDCAWENSKLSFAYGRQHCPPLAQIRLVMSANERLHQLRPIRVRPAVYT